MTIATILSLGETALKLGLICSLTVLALFLSYSMLNVCDLSTDGCFTLGAAVGAAVAVSGHPFLSIFAAGYGTRDDNTTGENSRSRMADDHHHGYQGRTYGRRGQCDGYVEAYALRDVRRQGGTAL